MFFDFGNEKVCGYNGVAACCNFAIAVGVIAFLICLAFLVKDFMMVIVDFSQAMQVKWCTLNRIVGFDRN